MADSKRLQILKAFATQMLNIKRADGYNFDIQRASHGYIRPSQALECPCAGVLSLSSNYYPLTRNEYTSGGSIQGIDGWPVAVIGYVKTAVDDQALAKAMEDFIKDIETAVLADHTLGLSFVHNAYLQTVDSIPDDSTGNFGTIMVIFRVKYDFEKDDL